MITFLLHVTFRHPRANYPSLIFNLGTLASDRHEPYYSENVGCLSPKGDQQIKSCIVGTSQLIAFLSKTALALSSAIHT